MSRLIFGAPCPFYLLFSGGISVASANPNAIVADVAKGET